MYKEFTTLYPSLISVLQAANKVSRKVHNFTHQTFTSHAMIKTEPTAVNAFLIWPIEYLTNWKTGGKKCYIDKGMLIVQLNPNEGYEGMKESVPS